MRQSVIAKNAWNIYIFLQPIVVSPKAECILYSRCVIFPVGEKPKTPLNEVPPQSRQASRQAPERPLEHIISMTDNEGWVRENCKITSEKKVLKDHELAKMERREKS